MSLEATIATWRLTNQQVSPKEKFFLLACAEYADEDNCISHLEKLSVMTGLDNHELHDLRISLINRYLLELVPHPRRYRLTYVESILNMHYRSF